MITRLDRRFILEDDKLSLGELEFKANMYGYPFIIKDDILYQVICNNAHKKVKRIDVTKKYEVM